MIIVWASRSLGSLWLRAPGDAAGGGGAGGGGGGGGGGREWECKHFRNK